MKKSILLLSLLALGFFSQAQKVTLFSGTPTPGVPGCDVGGSGTYPSVATYGRPFGLATDTNGNIYVAENENNRIRIILSDYSLVYSRVGSSSCPAAAGSKDAASSSALFYSPTGIAVGPDNKLYVCDGFNNTIRKVDAYSNAGNAQSVVTLAGTANLNGSYTNGTGGAAGFDYPSDVAVDKNGNVYVADFNNNCIRKITSGGVVTTFAGSTTSGFADANGASAKFDHPKGLCIDKNGDLLVADFGNYRIRKVNIASTPSAEVTTIAGNGQQTVKDGSSSSASFNTVNDLVMDKNGNIYVVEGDASHVVRKIDVSGNVTTLAGKFNEADTTNGNGTTARFNTLTGITLSKDQKSLFVADGENNTIRQIDISSSSPTIDFSSDKTNITANSTVNFTNATSVTTGTTYAWTITPGVSGTDWMLTTGTLTSRDISVKFIKAGTYNIEMKADNSAWGSKTITKTAMIKVTTGIEYIPLSGLEIYPNPNNTGKLLIESKEYVLNQVQVIDMQGKLISTIPANGSRNLVLDMSAFEKGIYMIKTTSGDLNSISKIIVQ